MALSWLDGINPSSMSPSSRSVKIDLSHLVTPRAGVFNFIPAATSYTGRVFVSNSKNLVLQVNQIWMLSITVEHGRHG